MMNLKLRNPGRIYKSSKSRILENFNKENKQGRQHSTIIYVSPPQKKHTALVVIKQLPSALQKYK